MLRLPFLTSLRSGELHFTLQLPWEFAYADAVVRTQVNLHSLCRCLHGTAYVVARCAAYSHGDCTANQHAVLAVV